MECLVVAFIIVVGGGGIYYSRRIRKPVQLLSGEEVPRPAIAPKAGTVASPNHQVSGAASKVQVKSGSAFDKYLELYHQAERLRKQGRGTEAIPLYQEAIHWVERSKDSKLSAPPAPYVSFAKMLYHMGEDEMAVDVVNRLISWNEDKIGRDKATEEFRDQIASQKLRRMKNKYQ